MCSSGKRAFATRAKARKALRMIAGPSRDCYCCPECGEWHLTRIRQSEWRGEDWNHGHTPDSGKGVGTEGGS